MKIGSLLHITSFLLSFECKIFEHGDVLSLHCHAGRGLFRFVSPYSIRVCDATHSNSSDASLLNIFYLGKVIKLHPFINVLLFYTIVAITAAFVPPKPLLRLGAVGVLLASVVLGLQHIDPCQVSIFWLHHAVECVCGVMLYSIQFIFLMNATPPPGSNWVGKLMWAVGLECNPRGIGTPWQIRNLPPFDRKNPRYVPSRAGFLVQRIVNGLLVYAMFKASLAADDIYWAILQEGDYSEYKTSIIRRILDVSMREILIRAWLPLHFLFEVYCQHQYWHCLVSVIAVALGDEPRRWPPLYGDIRDAYSLRRFWG